MMKQIFRTSLKSPRDHLHKETQFCSSIMPKDFLSSSSNAQKKQISSYRLLYWSWRCGKWNIFHQAARANVPSPPQLPHKKPAVKLEFLTWGGSELCPLVPWALAELQNHNHEIPVSRDLPGPLVKGGLISKQLHLNMTDPHHGRPWDTQTCQTHHLSPKQNASDLQAEFPSPSRLIHYKIAAPGLMAAIYSWNCQSFQKHKSG